MSRRGDAGGGFAPDLQVSSGGGMAPAAVGSIVPLGMGRPGCAGASKILKREDSEVVVPACRARFGPEAQDLALAETGAQAVG